ncbi:MAG TPA: MBL fold metallo-hydrolase [Cyclobacteriaceae bacterium]
MTLPISFLISFFLLLHGNFQTIPTAKLETIKWISGSADCAKNKDVPIQVVRYNANTWILRQNKCIHYEAPFLFLFIGETKALLMDTGATSDANSFPIQATVDQLIATWQKENNKKVELVVAHTHSHSDHWTGDVQFKNKPNTTVVGLSEADVQQFFNFKNWPEQITSFDLGNRKVELIPIPGHDKTSIALYDEQTQLLLTGDSFYPGRLYVRDWIAFKKSIQRLVDFTANHKISYLVGNHIEMSTTAGKDYTTGSKWHPEEHSLPLTIDDLNIINRWLNESSSDQPVYKVFNDFIVVPK